MKNKNKKIKKMKQTTIVIALICGMLFSVFSLPHPEIKDEPSWHVIWKGSFAEFAMAEADPGSGVAGILEIFFVNNTKEANNSYSINTSATIEGWCTAAGLGFADADDFYTELSHSVAFDIVVRVRANKTICANSTESYGVYNQGRLRVNITSADLGINALSPMVQVNTSNLSGNPYCYSNFWINWTGAYDPTDTGYQLTVDQVATITEIRFEAYY